MTSESHSVPQPQFSNGVASDMAEAAVTPRRAASPASQNVADPSKSVEMRQQQVRQSILTLERGGYRFRSIDMPSKSLFLGLDGSACTSDEVAVSAQRSESVEPESEQPAIVHAVVGTFALDIASYVLVVTDSRCRGTVAGSQIYETTAVAALPLSPGSSKTAFASMLRRIRRANVGKRDGTPQSGDESSDGNTAPTASASATPEAAPNADDGSAKSMAAASLAWISPQFTKLFGRDRAGSTSSIKGIVPSLAGLP
ncbi:hypothetical protein GGF44_001892, partial [Coemansia sp. RSA 1694]